MALIDDAYKIFEYDRDDWLWLAAQAEEVRKGIVWRVQRDLYRFGTEQLALSAANVTGKIDDLFTTFAAEWAVFVLTGSRSIATAITNDATLAWLDTVAGPQTIRQHLLDRLA